MEEARLAGKSFGSTKSGIAPFYSDKYSKIGFQVSELYGDEADLREHIDHVLAIKNVLMENLYQQPALKAEDVFAKLMEYKELLAPYVADTASLLHQAVKEGKTILLEGQLGSLKDPDFGIYPMVTSSSTLAGYGAVGAGVPPYEIKQIITVVKAYSSAVGAGEFVSESSGKKPTSSVAVVVTVVNTVPQRAGRAAWVGWIWWLPGMVARCRVQPMLPLRYWMHWAIWMKSLSVLHMNLTASVWNPSR